MKGGTCTISSKVMPRTSKFLSSTLKRRDSKVSMVSMLH